MLKLKKHHYLVLALVILFIIAWSVWTLVLLPRSEAPSLPNPAEAPSAPSTR